MAARVSSLVTTFVWVFCLAAGAFGQTAPLVRSWGAEDGLPNDKVTAIAQTPDGFLWLGTDQGIVRFDGVRFLAFGPQNGAPPRPVKAIVAGGDGTVWAAIPGAGVLRERNGVFTTFTKADGLPSANVVSMAADGAGGVWAGTDEGLARWNGGRFATVPQPPGFNPKFPLVTGLLARRSGELWAVTADSKRVIWKNGGWAGTVPNTPGNVPMGNYMDEDGNGVVWAVTVKNIGVKFYAGGWHEVPFLVLPAGLATVAAGPKGEVACVFHSGAIWEVSGTQPALVCNLDPASHAQPISACYDKDGQLWIGTYSNGLYRLSTRCMESIVIEPQAGTMWPVRALAELAPGVFIVGSEGNGFWKMENGVAARLDMHVRSQEHIRYGDAILKARDGAVCLGSEFGVWRYRDGAEKTRLTLPGFENGDYIQTLAEDNAGVVWAGSEAGQLYRIQGDDAKLANAGADDGSVHSILPTPDGALWYATLRNGVRRIQDGRNMIMADGLRVNKVMTLQLDAAGRLWAGTFGGGLARFQDGHFQSLGTEAGLYDDTVLQILADSSGRLWLAGPRGLSVAPEAEINAVLDGRARRASLRVFGRRDGIASAEFLVMRPIRDSQGRLCFGSKHGYVRVDPGLARFPEERLHVAIEQVRVDGESRFQQLGGAWSGGLDLGVGVAQVEIGFTVPELSSAEQTRFRWRLAGLDDHWRDNDEQRSVALNRLPPGQYRFEVTASQADGTWTTPVALTFTLRPHYWQTWWFLACCFLGAAGIAGFFVREVVGRRAERALAHIERARAVEGERVRIARDLHDEVGAGLTKIGKLAEAVEDSPVFHAAREVVQALDEIVWTVNPRNDTLENMAGYIVHYTEQFLKPTGIACHLEVPMNLPDAAVSATLRHHLYSAVKEALNNAVKHGAPRNIWLCMDLNGAWLTVEVRDDGRGFAVTPSAAGADGFVNMRVRMENIGGRLRVNSQPGRGTVITMEAPLSAGLQP